jgi:hypothetical protein
MPTFVYVPAPTPESPTDFAAEIVRDAIDVARVPQVALAGALVSLVPDLVLVALRWPFHDTRITPEEPAITTMACLILAKAWLTLAVWNMALAWLRRQPVGFLTNWVPVQTALRVGVVNIPLLAAIALASLAFMVPGLYLLAMWSQVPMAMVDNQSRWFDAANYSASLTDGYKIPLVVLWLIVMMASAVVTWTIGTALPFIGLGTAVTPLTWALRAALSVWGAALGASMYFNLDERAPWKQIA